ncbi:MFS transporter [Dysgonomonas capnocytophagoides]|uniref:MFS transporter n=1 Tax=Dysgonomonas capnocytophagoides TaxID=45254 RepID=A0A4Y8L8Z4_9BACT|nr:MFS transporter [Dysgonomonas capnocytophagoides]TFD99105.1 MFS transporter [Dysgonomonas capnocytophagoides]
MLQNKSSKDNFINIDNITSKTTIKDWLAVLSLALGSFSTVTAEFIPVGILPEVSNTFQISSGTAGLMMTIPGLLAAISGLSIPILSRNMDRKKILVFLTLILLASCFLAFWAPNFTIILVSRAMVGVSLGAFWAMSLMVAGRLVSVENVNKATALVFAGVTTAMIFGVPLGTFIGEMFSWREAFLATGAISFLALLTQLFFLPNIAPREALKVSSLLNILKKKQVLISLLMITLMFMVHFGTYTYLKPLLEKRGLTSEYITLLLLGFGVAGFVSNFVASYFLNKNVKATLAVSMIVLIIPLLFLPLSFNTNEEVFVLVLIWGIAWGALPLCLNVWNRNTSPDNIEPISALFTFTTQVAISIGSAVGGLLVDMFNVEKDYLIGGIVVFVGLFILLIQRTQRKSLYITS